MQVTNIRMQIIIISSISRCQNSGDKENCINSFFGCVSIIVQTISDCSLKKSSLGLYYLHLYVERNV